MNACREQELRRLLHDAPTDLMMDILVEAVRRDDSLCEEVFLIDSSSKQRNGRYL